MPYTYKAKRISHHNVNKTEVNLEDLLEFNNQELSRSMQSLGEQMQSFRKSRDSIKEDKNRHK